MSGENPAVSVGQYYITETHQLRKVVEVFTDDEGVKRVRYLSKSARIEGREFGYATTKERPPKHDKFLQDSGKLLDESEVDKLRHSNIILENE